MRLTTLLSTTSLLTRSLVSAQGYYNYDDDTYAADLFTRDLLDEGLYDEFIELVARNPIFLADDFVNDVLSSSGSSSLRRRQTGGIAQPQAPQAQPATPPPPTGGPGAGGAPPPAQLSGVQSGPVRDIDKDKDRSCEGAKIESETHFCQPINIGGGGGALVSCGPGMKPVARLKFTALLPAGTKIDLGQAGKFSAGACNGGKTAPLNAELPKAGAVGAPNAKDKDGVKDKPAGGGLGGFDTPGFGISGGGTKPMRDKGRNGLPYSTSGCMACNG